MTFPIGTSSCALISFYYNHFGQQKKNIFPAPGQLLNRYGNFTNFNQNFTNFTSAVSGSVVKYNVSLERASPNHTWTDPVAPSLTLTTVASSLTGSLSWSDPVGSAVLVLCWFLFLYVHLIVLCVVVWTVGAIFCQQSVSSVCGSSSPRQSFMTADVYNGVSAAASAHGASIKSARPSRSMHTDNGGAIELSNKLKNSKLQNLNTTQKIASTKTIPFVAATTINLAGELDCTSGTDQNHGDHDGSGYRHGGAARAVSTAIYSDPCSDIMDRVATVLLA